MERRDKIEIFCGVAAIIAAIAEALANGISASTILGAIKDIFGTLAIIILFFTVIWERIPKHYSDFGKLFDEKMKGITTKYQPVIEKDSTNPKRYNLDTNFSTYLCGEKSGQMRTFFEFTEKSLTFSVKKDFFMGRSTESFDEMQKKIISETTAKLNEMFQGSISIKSESSAFTVEIIKQQKQEQQVQLMCNIVDSVLILYLAECKK